jgi:GNAT superfamily N-acetyltransferase
MGNIRFAQKGDEKAIHELIVALAIFEHAESEVINTPENLAKDLFEEQVCNAYVVEIEGAIVGFALWYTSYSTWKGKSLYLEDFYVHPDFRNQKIGSQLFDKVVELAKSFGVKRMDWQVLDWNENAIEFYKRKNALLYGEWLNGRLFF